MSARTTTLLALGSLTVIGVGFYLAGPRRAAPSVTERAAAALEFGSTPARLARGEYLVEGVAHCFGCHSEIDPDSRPLEPVRGRKGAGRMAPPTDAFPFALVFPNITPRNAAAVPSGG